MFLHFLLEISCVMFITTVTILLMSVNGDEGLQSAGPKVTIRQGVLEGRTAMTKSGSKYDSYQGIPYAEPPLGNLRFRTPQPPAKWNGARDAKSPGSACIQYDPIFVKKTYGTEDCLYLNVYIPKVVHFLPLPVMVFIHGGAFQGGDGSPTVYGPDYFMENRVILVTMNYRLGFFGFLSLNTEDVPGNAGLKDQSFALKWVQDNILNFGGDPNRVTIFGESSGAGSVEYHMLSSMSKGLFGGAIMQSGSSLCPWGLDKHPEIKALTLAASLGMPEGTKDVGNFLRTIPESDLLKAQLSKKIFPVPTVEKIFPNVPHFITRSPKEILDSGQFNRVPTITGLNSYEGLLFRTSAFSYPDKEDDIIAKRIPDVKQFVPEELINKYGENYTEQIEGKIKQFYFPTTDNLSENYTNLLSDYMFNRDVISSVKLLAKYSSPVYFYKFSYDGSKNLLRLVSNLTYTGSGHTDELPYLFDVELDGIDKIPLTFSDGLISKRLLEMWTNFAKLRIPTPVITLAVPLIWTPVIPLLGDLTTLDIDKNLKLVQNLFAERMKFWDDLMQM